MTEIRIGVVGKILKGDDAGSFIKVVDDSTNTGGYLVFTSSDTSFRESYDDWVENLNKLESYFAESRWTIQWIR